MIKEIIAERYARALLDAAAQNVNEKIILDQFGDFIKLLDDNPDLNNILISPAISPLKKKNLIETVSKKMELNIIFEKLLLLLNEKGRMSIIRELQICFRNALDTKRGIITADLYHTGTISKSDIEKITKQLERLKKKIINLNLKEDKSLLGGVKIIIDGTVYDGSIKSKLEMLRTQLTGE